MIQDFTALGGTAEPYPRSPAGRRIVIARRQLLVPSAMRRLELAVSGRTLMSPVAITAKLAAFIGG